MTSTARLYVVAGALVLFFVLWATIAASPWATAKPDPRLAALQRRELVVRREAAAVQAAYQQRWATYRARLAAQKAHQATVAAAAPQVRVVQLPPVVTTRTS